MFNRNLTRVVLGAAVCSLLLSAAALAQAPFVRGDVNCDGVIDTLDPKALSNYLTAGAMIPCLDAGDFDDNGVLAIADLVNLTSYVTSGSPLPAPPFPNCGYDLTADGLTCLSYCCGGVHEHFKTWQIQFEPFTVVVSVDDQFMSDELNLSGLDFLSNPARKDTLAIIHPDDHLTWYRATGRDTLLEVEFVNQFEHDTVVIDSVTHLLVPTQKAPHAPPRDSLDHYKAYRIKNPEWFVRHTVMQDQFDADDEVIDTLKAVYFLTPASKNSEPMYDPQTHYVAYDFAPKTATSGVWTLTDQFGSRDVSVQESQLLLVPSLKLNVNVPEEPDTLKNHFKTWRIEPPTTFNKFAWVDDQFMSDTVELFGIEYLSNPARKDTSAIHRPNDHLNWYRATGWDTLLWVAYSNQFGLDTVIIDQVTHLVVPCRKDPHEWPDSLLGHYTSYRVIQGHTYSRPGALPVEVQDQFDIEPELVDSLVPRFFLVPCEKNFEPSFGSDTHYVAYEIYPKTERAQTRFTEDQFGAWDLEVWRSELLLVPSQKLAYGPPEPPVDTLKNHYKSWRVDPPAPFNKFVWAEDQFMADTLELNGIEFLANPARKDTSEIRRPNDHLNWYRATGWDTLLWVAYNNQFGPDTLVIGGVTHLLVPCRKDPHEWPDSLLGHYTSYGVIEGTTYFNAAGLSVEIEDQFDSFPEYVDSLVPRYFLVPSVKNWEPSYGSDTHYVAYEIFPKTFRSQTRFTEDQFGNHELDIISSELLLVPTEKLAYGVPEQPDTLRNHFKTWGIDFIPFDGSVDVQDQFMSDVLSLNGLVFLSNPARKDTSDIKRPNDHLNWYSVTGLETSLRIEYENQFGLDTVTIDSVRHLLVPCQKEPHDPPDSLLGHYKSYRIKDAKMLRWVGAVPLEIEDQFDLTPEQVDSALPVLFLTPCTKNGEPIPAHDTHYVAYEIFPKTGIETIRTTTDQFGTWTMNVRRSVFLLVPTHKRAYWTPPDTLKNHFKSWRLEPLPFDTVADVKDQFMADALRVGDIEFISNPTRKDTYDIVRPDDHLLWYGADGRDTCLEIVYGNQFGTDTCIVGTVSYLLLPAQKFPHPPPDPTLDHYKAYKVWDPKVFSRPTELQDQFDVDPEFIEELKEAYFLTPASKNAEPLHDSGTHYMAYEIIPRQEGIFTAPTNDQFGDHTVVTKNSEMLLVPTEKIEHRYFCPILTPGDVNVDGVVTSADIIYLVNYVFKGGPPPIPCAAAGDVNCDGVVTSADIIYLVNYVFKGGPPPCDPCTIIPSKWLCPC